MKNLTQFLEAGDDEEKKERLRFYRSLVPNAVLLRGPDGFVCGLCGSSYLKRSTASSCLSRCLRARENEGVITVTALGGTFSCPKCGKRYARREDAIDCHGRGRRLSKIYLAQVPVKGAKNWDDSGYAGLKETDKPGKGRLLKLSLRLEAMVPFTITHDLSNPSPPGAASRVLIAQNENQTSSINHNSVQSKGSGTHTPVPFEDSDSSLDEAVAPVQKVALKKVSKAPELAKEAEEYDSFAPLSTTDDSGPPQTEEDGPFREMGMKPFTRHDARYKCSVCAQMYFTRSDVEACFFSHPERMV